MLLGILAIKRNLVALHDHLYLAWVIKFQTLANPLFYHLFVVELTLRWCVVYFE